ncbi:MAG: barstar family protein [Peribacillus sp.]
MELWKSLLLNGAVKLFQRTELLDACISDISREGFEIHVMDCSKWDLESYHNDLASILHFPDYYGKNLDAFHDCLLDMAPEGRGMVLVFKNYDLFANKEPEVAYRLLDIVQTNAWRFLLEDIKLLAFVQSNDATMEFPRLGGMPAEWNNEEWLNVNRG